MMNFVTYFGSMTGFYVKGDDDNDVYSSMSLHRYRGVTSNPSRVVLVFCFVLFFVGLVHSFDFPEELLKL